MNLNGVIARQSGDFLASERLIRKAIKLKPGVANYHHHLARTLELLQRTDDAVVHYRRAINLNPSDVESQRLLGNLLLNLGQVDKAITSFERVLELDPKCADVCYRLGAIHKSSGAYTKALELYRRAVALFPHSSDSNFNLGVALFEAGQISEAIPYVQRTIELNPDDHEAHNLLGKLFHKLIDYPAARSAYLNALHLKPDNSDVISNLGALYLDAGDVAKSEILLRRAIELTPTLVKAKNNLGLLLASKGLILEAIEQYKNVLSLRPGNVPALCALGDILSNLGDEEAAQACFRLALESEPGSVVALFNTSSSLLAAGHFAEGWEAYEMRWQFRHFEAERPLLNQPRWIGQDLTGRRLFLHAEQGLGDTLQFVRYAILLADRGIEIILAVQPALRQLLLHLHPSIQVVVYGQESLPAFDFYCPLLSLPRIFQTDLLNIPSQVPYIRPRPEDLSYWEARIDSPNLRVGIVWAGNPLHQRDRIRSVAPAQFGSVTDVGGISFYSLQKGPAVAHLDQMPSIDPIVDLDSELRDFTDTAAAIAQLDLVITVDTSVAHLAGALGKPVWILLSHASDWRWLKQRADSPWYPTARLFRQSVLGEWNEVLAQVRHSLETLVANRQYSASAQAGIASILYNSSGQATLPSVVSQ